MAVSSDDIGSHETSTPFPISLSPNVVSKYWRSVQGRHHAEITCLGVYVMERRNTTELRVDKMSAHRTCSNIHWKLLLANEHYMMIVFDLNIIVTAEKYWSVKVVSLHCLV